MSSSTVCPSPLSSISACLFVADSDCLCSFTAAGIFQLIVDQVLVTVSCLLREIHNKGTGSIKFKSSSLVDFHFTILLRSDTAHTMDYIFDVGSVDFLGNDGPVERFVGTVTPGA